MIKKSIVKGVDLSQSLILKSLMIFFIMMSFAITSLRAEEVKQLQLSLGDGTFYGINLIGNVIMTPTDGGVLKVISDDGLREFPLKDITRFNLTGGVSVFGVSADNSLQWSIFTINGTPVCSGNGLPDFSSLIGGDIYIVRQGTLSYKFLKR